MTQSIGPLSDAYYDDYTQRPEVEGRAKWLDIESEESVTETFKQLRVLPMFGCSRFEVKLEAVHEDKNGNRVGGSISVAGEPERSSESNKSGSSGSSNNSNSSKSSNESKKSK